MADAFQFVTSYYKLVCCYKIRDATPLPSPSSFLSCINKLLFVEAPPPLPGRDKKRNETRPLPEPCDKESGELFYLSILTFIYNHCHLTIKAATYFHIKQDNKRPNGDFQFEIMS